MNAQIKQVRKFSFRFFNIGRRNKISLFIIMSIIILCLTFITIQKKDIENKVHNHLKINNIKKTDLKKMHIKYSLLNFFLSYNVWTISVEYKDEPGVNYMYSYKNKKIIFTGIAGGEINKDKSEYKHLEYEGIDIVLTTLNDNYHLNTETIIFNVKNYQNNSVEILLIPILEIKENNQWIKMTFTDEVGFCGTPDNLEDELDVTLELKWFKYLKEGEYKLSYKIKDDATDKLISTRFKLSN